MTTHQNRGHIMAHDLTLGKYKVGFWLKGESGSELKSARGQGGGRRSEEG